MSERVLVTGGRGFFGRRIAQACRERGYEVVTPSRPHFDLHDRTSIDRALNEIRPDTVVHPAAYYGGLGICVAEPATIFHHNVLMTVNLLDAIAHAGVRRFVSIGSACAYAGNVAGDMNEDDYWSGPLHPSVEAYGFTKKVQQVGMKAYHKQHGLQFQEPIFTNLYGEHDVFTEYRSHVAAALIKKFVDAADSRADHVECWGTGAPVREFLYVGDAAEAVPRLMATNCSEPVNIGTGIGTSIKELAEIVAHATGFEGDIVWNTDKPDGVMRKVLDVGRMQDLLGWQPPTALEVGVRKTVAWYRANTEEADSRR